jgi:trimeric autotransporter adhesin
MPGRLVFSTTADGASSPTERMRIQSDGNILIGVTSGATGLLNVGPVANKTGIFGSASTAGSAGIQGAHTVNSATGYVAYFANSGSATGLYISNTAAWQSTSDERLKTDIQDLDAVSRLMQIKPRSYLWKSQATSDEPTKRNLGFIAQEVQEVFPELVGESPDGMLSVEYTGLIAPLVNTIQFLKAEIDALKAEVTALKAQ